MTHGSSYIRHYCECACPRRPLPTPSPSILSVAEITQLQIFFKHGNERRLNKSKIKLCNYSPSPPSPPPPPHIIIILSIEDRVHCRLKQPHKCIQTTLACSLHPYIPAVTILSFFFFKYMYSKLRRKLESKTSLTSHDQSAAKPDLLCG